MNSLIDLAAQAVNSTQLECSLYGIVPGHLEPLLRERLIALCGGLPATHPFLEHEIGFVPANETPDGVARNDDIILRLNSQLDPAVALEAQPALHERKWVMIQYGKPEVIGQTAGVGGQGAAAGAAGGAGGIGRAAKGAGAAAATGGVGGGAQQSANGATIRPAVYANIDGGDVFKFMRLLGYTFGFEHVRRGYWFSQALNLHIGQLNAPTPLAVPPSLLPSSSSSMGLLGSGAGGVYSGKTLDGGVTTSSAISSLSSASRVLHEAALPLSSPGNGGELLALDPSNTTVAKAALSSNVIPSWGGMYKIVVSQVYKLTERSRLESARTISAEAQPRDVPWLVEVVSQQVPHESAASVANLLGEVRSFLAGVVELEPVDHLYLRERVRYMS